MSYFTEKFFMDFITVYTQPASQVLKARPSYTVTPSYPMVYVTPVVESFYQFRIKKKSKTSSNMTVCCCIQ